MAIVGPEIVVIKKGALQALPEIVAKYGQAMFVSDAIIFDKYKMILDDFLDVDPTWIMVDDHPEKREPSATADVIVGFGGGRSIDTAKLIAAETGLEWISVPTAASHDGIASEAASVSHNGYRYSKRCKLPIAVIADLEIIAQAPRALFLAGTGDILCKTSSLSEWKMANEIHGESFNKEAFELTKHALDTVLSDESLETLIMAEIDAGKAMYLAGSSRPCSGTEHAISHAMERREHNLHGLQVIFATPLCLHYLEKAGYSLYDPHEIRKIMVARDLPLTLSSMSITMEQFLDDIHHALNIMRKRERHSVLEGVADDELRRMINELYSEE
ncbi:MAG: iron-containing alcohol dehydrogenase [Candidatus Thorarchaeota archaeon]|nr:iron-containing alcohol dehydrogenase [Candidatus Thorarchaeota archaeon]